MTYVPAAMPELLVVGSTGDIDTVSGSSCAPVMLYNPAEDRVEAHYFYVGRGNHYDLPQGMAFNLTPDVIGVCSTNSGVAPSVRIRVRLFDISTVKSDGAAFSGGATDLSTAIYHNNYALTDYLEGAGSGWSDWDSMFILPYTLDQFLIVTPQYVYRINISDGSVAGEFAIDPDNASYSKLWKFGTKPQVCSPVVLPDGNVAVFANSALKASDSSATDIAAVLKINPLTGVTLASDYTTLSASQRQMVSFPDGSIATVQGSDASAVYKFSSDLSSSIVVSGMDVGFHQSWGVTPDGQDKWWSVSRPSSAPYHPTLHVISGATGTSTILDGSPAEAVSTAAANSNYTILSVFDETRIFFRGTASNYTGTGTSIGSYIGVYNKSDGSVATGYSKQQMLDYYGGNAISGSDFNSNTFARENCRSFPDPTLYTVREVVKTMGTDSTPGTTCKVYDGTQWVTAVPKVYDGTQWVTATPKVRDASGWV